MSPNADDENKVSFSATADVEGGEAVPVERKNAEVLRSSKDRASISASCKAWDIDGDGVLDDTEMALKAIDKTGKGTLSKEQMYQLMNQNLAVQKELSGVKKVVFGLVGFTVVLALANVGTSFAAAYLAKDTHMEDGKLVGEDGKTVQTEAALNKFELMDEAKAKEMDEYRRELCQLITSGNGNNAQVTSATGCAVNGTLHLTPADGANFIEACQNGGTASISKMWDYGGGNTCTSVHHYCGQAARDAGVGDAVVSTASTSTGCNRNGKNCATTTTTKTMTFANAPWDMTVTLTDAPGDAEDTCILAQLKSLEGQCCASDGDCAEGAGSCLDTKLCGPVVAGEGDQDASTGGGTVTEEPATGGAEPQAGCGTGCVQSGGYCYVNNGDCADGLICLSNPDCVETCAGISQYTCQYRNS